MRVRSLTPFPFGTKVTSRAGREREIVVIVRGLFRLRPGEPVAPGDPVPLTADRFLEGDDERAGECLYASDFADAKRGAEILVRGTCHAPAGQPVEECSVGVIVGSWSKRLRVVGRRTWVNRGGVVVPSDAEPFVTMPLTWCNAFGGLGWARNPVGKGIEGDELPNMEALDEPVRTRSDRPAPACFGPINPAWAPRKDKVGTSYGESWRKQRAPFYADDFDWTFFHAAPDDQQLPRPLRGDEPFAFENMHPRWPSLTGHLPGVRIRALLRTSLSEVVEAPMALDTLFADLDEGTIALTWRGHAPVLEDDLADVKTLLLAQERTADEELPREHYVGVLERFEADPFDRDKLMPPAVKDALAAAKEKPDGPDPIERAAGRMRDAVAGRSPEVKSAAEGVVSQLRAAASRVGSSASAPAPAATDIVATQLAAAVDRLKKMRAGLADESGASPADPARVDALLDHPALAKLTRAPGREEPGPGRDLSGRDFSRCDLSGRDLSGANLRGAKLARANLAGARLVGADLRETILADAQMQGANAEGADLTRATAVGANLAGARLVRARLDGALLAKADLSGADLDEARGERVLLAEAKLIGARARRARLVEAMFLEANLQDADFAGAVLYRCLFFAVRAHGIKLAGAAVNGSSFGKSDLTGADGTELRGERSVWREATLERADLRWARLPHANFDGAAFRKTLLSAADLKGASFYRASFEDVNVEQANLFEANLQKARLLRTSFRGSNLYSAKLLGALREDCSFDNANLERAVLDPS